MKIREDKCKYLSQIPKLKSALNTKAKYFSHSCCYKSAYESKTVIGLKADAVRYSSIRFLWQLSFLWASDWVHEPWVQPWNVPAWKTISSTKGKPYCGMSKTLSEACIIWGFSLLYFVFYPTLKSWWCLFNFLLKWLSPNLKHNRPSQAT